MLVWHERTTFAPMFNLLSEHEQLAACYMRRLEIYSSQVKQLPVHVPACVCPSNSMPIFYFDFCYWLRRHASASVEMTNEEDEAEERELLSAEDKNNKDANTAFNARKQTDSGGQQTKFTPQVCLCACDIFDPPSKPTPLSMSKSVSSLMMRRGARQTSAFASPPMPTSSAALHHHLPSMLFDIDSSINNNNAATTQHNTENRYHNYYADFKSARVDSADGNVNDDDDDALLLHNRHSNGVCGALPGRTALPLATHTSIISLDDDDRGNANKNRQRTDSINGSRLFCSSCSALFLMLPVVLLWFLSMPTEAIFVVVFSSRALAMTNIIYCCVASSPSSLSSFFLFVFAE